jgi:hypothetical protein
MGETMNIYQAIMKAADRIEQYPQEFNFGSIGVPNECGTPGCALGWIGFYADVTPGIVGFSTAAREILRLPATRYDGAIEGAPEFTFYKRMDELTGGTTAWRNSAPRCARGLRLYAAKYHADDKPITKSDAALVADLMTRVMGAKIPETAPSPELVS